ncbi:MAG: hypothetical protein PHO76_02610 [Methylotenera sp.]|nr:hypothetical protein [Methylotenera sp.]MDD4927235.1 hypothetical protein [Methylotenera sp.]
MTLATNDGRLVIVSGSSRCGKTAKTVRMVKPFKTVFVWDIEAQWCNQKGFKKITSLAELKKIVIAGKAGKYAYVSGGNIKAEFEAFCKCVFHYGAYFGICAVVAEELADVTTTAKAPEGWGILCRRGLKRGITIFAISQRWAEADKTALGNATNFYLFRMASGSDIDYMSKKTRVEYRRLEGLKPLEYIHYDALTGINTFEKLEF